jgi:hypothetical protein
MVFHFIDYDSVIKSKFITAVTDYEFALQNFVPLIDRLQIQRNVLIPKFYKRLEQDILKGCIMPPITIAFISKEDWSGKDAELKDFILHNIEEGFILDGIQRLNTLHRVNEAHSGELDLKRHVFLNILVCPSMDNLLYRMITLNNGQKPMSAKHQIEILLDNLIIFDEGGVSITSEKDRNRFNLRGIFSKADFIKGYLAFLSNSTSVENQKIIEQKMDELIAEKILDSRIPENSFEFMEVVSLIKTLSQKKENYLWFKNANNLIGFCVAAKSSLDQVLGISPEEFNASINKFEEAFKMYDVSKINLGKYRRNNVQNFFKHFADLKNLDPTEIILELSESES